MGPFTVIPNYLQGKLNGEFNLGARRNTHLTTTFEVLDGATLPCPVIPYHLRFLDPTAATVALIKIGSHIWGMCLGPMCSRA